ncbi:MAG: DUF2971 domain-containing protein [Curvibacter sp.]|nr:MAG: DUF2971 domain-containing protein [Curvibacter sp.]
MTKQEVMSGGLFGPNPLNKEDEILYHYCSTSTFQQIVSNGTIRLSALTLSNDSLEGKLVSTVIKRLADADSVNAKTIDLLLGRVDALEEFFDGLGLCLSEDGDLLSQWRGYADDANGFSIGFSSKYLDWLNSSLIVRDTAGFQRLKVLYTDEEHDRELRPSYVEIMKNVNAGGLNPPMNKLASLLLGPISDEKLAVQKAAEEQLRITILSLFVKWFLLKSYAFREEREVRLLSYLIHGSDSEKIGYRATRNSIISYREYALIEKERMPIAHVILGPRQRTPVRDVEHFLRISGFENVKVERSKASYR